MAPLLRRTPAAAASSSSTWVQDPSRHARRAAPPACRASRLPRCTSTIVTTALASTLTTGGIWEAAGSVHEDETLWAATRPPPLPLPPSPPRSLARPLPQHLSLSVGASGPRAPR